MPDVITLPPLRERLEDIALLANHFGINMSTELDRELFAGFTDDAMTTLLAWHWPGNVRELKNVVERCVYRHANEGSPIDEVVFNPFDSPWRPHNAAEQSASPEAAVPFPLNLKETVQDFEIDLLKRALTRSRFNQRRAAGLLGLTYHQLRGYLRKYDLVGKEAASEGHAVQEDAP